MKNNPGKGITIYDLPGIAEDAFPLGTNTKNIQSGFTCSGIFPFNSAVFEDHVSCTDRTFS